MAASNKTLAFVARHVEAVFISFVCVLALIGVVCLALGAAIAGAILLAFAVASAGFGTWLAIMYHAWEKLVEEQNLVALRDGELAVELTPEQYEAVIRDGFVILPDGSHVVADKYKKSGKMKHIKAEDHDALNGPIITNKNAGYDGPRINDFEDKYGKNFGKRTEK